MRRNILGFTLIELMVTVTILSILGAISYSIFSGARRNANDAKMAGDVNQIAKAYEAKYVPETETYQELDPLKDFASQTLPQHPTGGVYELTWDETNLRYFRVCAKLNKYYTTSQAGTCTNTELPLGCYCRVNSQGIVPDWASLSPDIGPPSAPLNLVGISGGNQASLSWQRPLSNGNLVITGYNIYRGTTAGNRTLLTNVPSNNVETESYVNTTLINGTTYYYTVRAVNNAGESLDSTEVSVIPLSVPSASTTLTAVNSGLGSVTLTWVAPSDNGGSAILGYNVYYSCLSPCTPSSPTQVPSLVTSTSYLFSGLTNGSDYTFTVKAVSIVGEGPGASVNANTFSVPSAPTTLTAVNSGLGSVTLTWVAPSDNGGSAILGYNVYYSCLSPCSPTTPTKSNPTLIVGFNYNVTGLTNGSDYTFTVKAVNAAGEGPGASVTATLLSCSGVLWADTDSTTWITAGTIAARTWARVYHSVADPAMGGTGQAWSDSPNETHICSTGQSTTMTSPVINISSCASQTVNLKYNIRWKMDYPNYLFTRTEYSLNAGPYTVLELSPANGQNYLLDQWTAKTFPLALPAGASTIQIRYNMYVGSGGGTFCNQDGAHIDNIRLEK